MPRTTRLRAWLPLAAWLVAMAAGGTWFTHSALRERDEALELGRRQAASLAALAAENAGRMLDGAKMALHAMQSQVGPDPDWNRIAADRRLWSTLREWADELPAVPRLLLVDAQGITRVHTDLFPTPAVDLSDREHVRHHIADPSPAPFVARPIIGRVTGQPSLILSRRLATDDGRFNGAAIANVSPAAFEEFFASILPGQGGHISLMRADGIALVRHPHQPGFAGTRIAVEKVFEDFAAGADTGIADSISPVDGVHRLTAYYRLPSFGLVAVAGLSTTEILADWRRNTLRTASLLGGSSLALTLLLLLDTRRRLSITAAIHALAMSEADLRRAQEVGRIGSWRVDARSMEINCSAVTYRLYQLEEGAAVTWAMFMGYVHPDDRGKVEESFHANLKGDPCDLEHRVVLPTGVRWVRQRAEAVLDDWKVVAVVGTTEDITDRKLAEEQLRDSEERYRLLVANTPTGIFQYDTSLRIVFANQKLADILRTTRDALAGLDLGELRDTGILPTLKAAVAGDIATYEGRYTSMLGGHGLWVAMICAPLRDAAGSIIGGVAIVQDRTEQHEKDQELQHALDRLSASNAELERFAYVASHDLQEPLRTITSFAQLLHRRYHGRLDGDADEYIGFITASAERMHRLINDLLAYSRVSGQGKELQRVDTAAACRTALDNLAESIREAGATVEVGALPMSMGDAVQLAQVFQNLIGNALKFRRPDHPPRIEVTATGGDGTVEVTVADNGIGIEDTGQDIFEIFRRLHTVSAYPGTGVGLAIAKRIVQRHGGRIWVENRPEGGAAFRFTLPGA